MSAERQRRYRERHRTDRQKLAAELRLRIRTLRLLLEMVQRPERFDGPMTVDEVKRELRRL